MDVNFFTTAVQGSNIFNDVADFLLSPVRLVAGEERSWRVIKDEQTGQVVQATVDEVALRTYAIVHKLLAVMLGLMVVPIVIGAAFKCVALLAGSYYDYEALQQMKPGLYLEANSLAVVPTVVKPKVETADETQLMDQLYPLTKLLDHWAEVGKDRATYQQERLQLARWILVAPTPAPYAQWRCADPEGAAKQVEHQLKMILRELDKPISNDKKIKTLLDIIEKSSACAPTWVEFTDAIYMSFVSGDFRDYVLRIVQQFKENLVLNYIQVQGGGFTWHSINAVRAFWGSSLGLRAQSENDPYSCILDALCMTDFSDKFYSGYRLDRLVNFLEGEMHVDTQQHQDLIQFLIVACKKDRSDLNGSDLDEFVKETFFHAFGGDLTQTLQYQSFDKQAQADQAEIEKIQRTLADLNADEQIAELEGRLSSLDPDNIIWQSIVQQQQQMADQIAKLHQEENPSPERRVELTREKARLNREIAQLETQLEAVVDNPEWAPLVQERRKIIIERTKLEQSLKVYRFSIDSMDETRKEAMRGIELESRRFINQAGVVRILAELGIVVRAGG